MFDSDTLAQRGFVVAPGLIDPAECRALAALWPEQARFRSHIVMQRHGYGQGEYQYFTYPLPAPVERLREALYPELARIANRWNEQLGRSQRFPASLKAWLKQCHDGGQGADSETQAVRRPNSAEHSLSPSQHAAGERPRRFPVCPNPATSLARHAAPHKPFGAS